MTFENSNRYIVGTMYVGNFQLKLKPINCNVSIAFVFEFDVMKYVCHFT